MFQSLRPNSLIYVLHKTNKPTLESGYVISVSVPRAKYSMPPNFTQPQEMVVDIVARVDNTTINYNNLPANLDISDSFNNNETVIIADNRDAMNAKILNLKQESLDIVNSYELHLLLVTDYEGLLGILNPEIIERQLQKDEITTLKKQVQDMSSNIDELMKANRLLIEQLSKNKDYENVGNKRE